MEIIVLLSILTLVACKPIIYNIGKVNAYINDSYVIYPN